MKQQSGWGAPRRAARVLLWAGCVGMLGILTGCMTDSNSTADPFDAPILSDDGWVPQEPILPKGWPAANVPADNPYTATKAILGRRLFNERALGRDGTSCRWCHDPAAAFAYHHGGLGNVMGGLKPTRRGPATLVNAGFLPSLMSEGRAASLEEQAVLPLLDTNEMNMTAPEIEAILAADTAYVHLFRQAFGPGRITIARVAKALAVYQRTLVSTRSDYDRWQEGDSSAISPEAKQGAALFMGKADCARCHTPPLFTDGKFHNIGLDSIPVDKGRMTWTGLAEDEGKFRTPTLRNILRTPPYMHDGRFTDLSQVVAHYARGRRGRGADLPPIELTDREQYELTEFLRTLEDPQWAHEASLGKSSR